MASQTCVYTLKIVIFICICNTERPCDAFSCERSSAKFLVEPTDEQIRRGENAMFQCSVADFNPQTKFLKWKVYPDTEPNTPSLTEKVYDAVNRIFISNFTVQNASMHTQLYISCILEETIQQQTHCFSSRPAMMDVMYFPRQDDLSCGSSLNNVVHLGESLSLTCRVVRGNPPVDMTWTVLPSGIRFPPSLNDEGSLRTLSHDLFITLDLHLKRILCEVSSEFSFRGEKLQCSIGPIKVHHPPEVHIFPQTISIMSLDHVELTCTANAYPEVKNFTWTCFPEAFLKGCGIISLSRHNFTLNTTSLCTSQVEGVYVTCSAFNSEGSGVGYAYLDITKDTVSICQNNNTEYQENIILSSKVDLPVNINLYKNLAHEDFALVCVIADLSIPYSAHFQWYIDDALVTDNNMFLVQTLPAISTLKQFRSFHTPEFAQNFTCEVTVEGRRATASTNLSSLLKNKQRPCLTSSEYSGATPMSNHISVNGKLTEYTKNIVTSLYSEQSFVDGQESNKCMTKPFMMMVISGAALLTAIIIIIISMFVCRMNRKNGKEIELPSDMHIHKPQTTTSHTMLEYCTNIDIVDDTLYEVPNAHSEQTTSDVFAIYSSSSSTGDVSDMFDQNIHHDYYLGDSSEISSVN